MTRRESEIRLFQAAQLARNLADSDDHDLASDVMKAGWVQWERSEGDSDGA